MSEDNSWVFDSLVCFLHGPIWNVPLQTFIEEKSYLFDPNEKNDETNPIYHKIYEEYKTLVDYMLGSFMDEMQITPEQFEIACLEGRHQNQQSSSENPFNFHQGLFQQIWAANDIKIFIRLMKQRNVELQLQALDLIERKQHSTSQSEEDSNKDDQDEKNFEEQILDEENLREEDISKIVEKELDNKEHPNKNEPNEEKQDKFERLNLFFKNKEIDPKDVQARQEYLRTQRDKILQIKKKARAKQLNESMRKIKDPTDGISVCRPTSARVAQQILEGNNVNEVVEQDDAVSIVNPASELRKTLAKRLRAEVVDDE